MNLNWSRAPARLACAAFAMSALAAGLAPQAQAAKAGALDRSFGHNGRQLTDFFHHRDQANAVAIQEDGKSVVAGWAHNPKIVLDPLPALARYRRDGRLDRSFGHNGRLLLRSWEAGEVGALAIQNDGSIVVAGNASTELAVARFRRNGELDHSFGDGGTMSTDVGGLARAADVAIQPDGKIVVVGDTRGADGTPNYLVMARYLPNGSLDQSFGNGGSIKTRLGTDTYVLGYGVAIQNDGKIVVSGEVGNSWIVARFLVDGSLDAGFGNDGGVQHTEPVAVGQARDVAIQPNGKIVAAGVDFGGRGARFAVARYLPDGAPDLSFGKGGAARATFEPGLPSDYANALALQEDGKIVVAGTARFSFSAPNPARFALARYTPNGRLDRSFAGDGKQITGFRPHPPRHHRDYGMDVAIQANGRIVAVGQAGGNFALARYLGAPTN